MCQCLIPSTRLLRSDVALMVRQASLHIWKVVVTNTAQTLREILPTLIHLLLGCLASESHDKRKVAARTLGDLVRKLGERVLPEVIPMLEKGLGSKVKQERQGVCIGLSEIIEQTSRDNVLLYVDSLLPTVRNALRDGEPEVRAAAAMTFNSLHSNVGKSVFRGMLAVRPPPPQTHTHTHLCSYYIDSGCFFIFFLPQVLVSLTKFSLPSSTTSPLPRRVR